MLPDGWPTHWQCQKHRAKTIANTTIVGKHSNCWRLSGTFSGRWLRFACVCVKWIRQAARRHWNYVMKSVATSTIRTWLQVILKSVWLFDNSKNFRGSQLSCQIHATTHIQIDEIFESNSHVECINWVMFYSEWWNSCIRVKMWHFSWRWKLENKICSWKHQKTTTFLQFSCEFHRFLAKILNGTIWIWQPSNLDSLESSLAHTIIRLVSALIVWHMTIHLSLHILFWNWWVWLFSVFAEKFHKNRQKSPGNTFNWTKLVIYPVHLPGNCGERCNFCGNSVKNLLFPMWCWW